MAAATSMLALLTLSGVVTPGRVDDAPGATACDDLVLYLRDALKGPPPFDGDRPGFLYSRHDEVWLEAELRADSPYRLPAYAERVTRACRERVSRGAAPEVSAAFRAWRRNDERRWITPGRVLACAAWDPEALAELPAWMSDPEHTEARAFCAAELAIWPGADAVRRQVFAQAVRQERSGWTVDIGLVAAAHALASPALREVLVPVLADANEHHAAGYDRLRVAVCEDDGPMSSERANMCATLPMSHEVDGRARRKALRRAVDVAAATTVVAGLIAAAAVERNAAAGRAIATGAGALTGGLLVGGVLGALSVHVINHVSDGALIAATLVGCAAGGLGAYALSSSPSARAPVTAAGLAIPYAFTVAVIVFD